MDDETTTAREEFLLAGQRQAMQRISDLLDELSAIRDIAYRAGSGDAATDALEAIHVRASRSIQGDA